MHKYLIKSCFVLSIVLASLASSSYATTIENNPELAALSKEDQDARQGDISATDYKAIALKDAARREQVMKIIRSGQLHTAVDYFNAALIFQHGDKPESYQLAYSLANLAVTLNPEYKDAKWLRAAAWDRFMMEMKKPQWYGTQYLYNSASKKVVMYKVDPTAVTDAERIAEGLPTLKQAKANAAKFK